MPLPPSHDLRNAVLGSVALHLVVGIIGYVAMDHAPGGRGSPSLVDVELAPAAPKAEKLPDEIAAARQQEVPAPGEDPPAPPDKPDEAAAGELTPDAAPDARVDARPRRRADANELVATADAAPAVADDAATAVATVTTSGDAATQLATTPGSLGDATPGTGSGAGSGTPGAITTGDPAIAGEPGTGGPVSAGTAANLLAYAPSGHVVTALVRLDRLRGTTWQAPVVKLFEPMPDYNVMIGARKLDIADLFETLVISSPEPRNAIATTLVARTKLTRAKLRDLLDEPETPVTWSAARGGMLGTRKPGARVPRGDKRLFLSPYQGWIVLAQPRDLGGLTAPATAKADMDRAVATAPVPPWIDKVRRIEGETGAPTGPVAIVTVAGTEARFSFSDPGLGISSLPVPERMTVSLEIVKQGFIVRGNLKFAREADAIELVESITKARQRAIDSTVLRGLLARSRVLNAVKGLTLDRRGARVSYATSLAIKDAEGLLAVAAQTLRAYFEAAKAEP